MKEKIKINKPERPNIYYGQSKVEQAKNYETLLEYTNNLENYVFYLESTIQKFDEIEKVSKEEMIKALEEIFSVARSVLPPGNGMPS